MPEFTLNEAFTLGGRSGRADSERETATSVCRGAGGLTLSDAGGMLLDGTGPDCHLRCSPTTAVPTTVEFNTNPAPGQTVKVADVGPYSIELQSLDPYPQTPDAIAFKDYRATLVVHKR